MNKREQEFVEVVWQYYRTYGRHDLPWRKTVDPYKILVSEVMLQQTQVERVVPKYRAFLRAFPSARRLAGAPLREVLMHWQGLGYNRRAKFLRETAVAVTTESLGEFPKDLHGLQKLSGIGPYTAGAIMAFAYSKPTPLIETNVRQVYLHHFFKDAKEVLDSEVLHLVERTLQKDTVREWYWALMDYGAYLKRQHGNLGNKSKHYSKQSKFYGSDRQIRGAIIKLLTTTEQPLTVKGLQKKLEEYDGGRVAKQLAQLEAEGMVQKVKTRYQLA